MPTSLRSRCHPASHATLAVVTALGVCAGPAATASGRDDPFAECRVLAEEAHDTYAPYRCIWRTGAGLDRLEEADLLLHSYEEQGRSAWPILVRGHLAFAQPERALELYGRALARFEEQALGADPADSALGRVLIHSNRRLLWNRLGDTVRATAEVEAATRAVSRSEDPEARTRAALLRGQHLLQEVGALGPALRAFERAEAEVFPQGPVLLQRHVLDLLGLVQLQLGRWSETRTTYRRWQQLAEAHADLAGDLPTIEYNLINAHLNELEHLPDSTSLRQLIDRAERALSQATAVDNLRIQLFLHRSLAEMWAAFDLRRAFGHLDRCDAISEKEAIADARQCRWTRALLAAAEDPGRALALAETSLAEARENGQPVPQMWAARAVMRIAFDALEPAEATQRALELLAFLQDAQQAQSGLARAEMLDVWLEESRLVMARLIEQGKLEAAFELNEQRRSQLLLSELDRTGTSPTQEQREIDRAERELVEQQRALLQPDLGAGEREALERQLAEAERRLDEARERIDAARGRTDEARSTSLSAVQRSLAPDQALLVYAVGLDHDLYGRRADGSWLFVVTNNRLEVVAIADRSLLHGRVRAFLGMFQPGGQPIPAAMEAMRELVLAPALRVLAKSERNGDDAAALEFTTLLVAPDDLLHSVPFSLLSDADQQVAIVPSATVWQRLRGRALRPASTSRLLVGDPHTRTPQPGDVDETESPPGPGDTEQGEDPIFLKVAGLPALPWARREIRHVRRLLGDAQQLVGEHATEASLKASLQREPPELLHLATHALIDTQEPQRSSIVLAGHPVLARDDSEGLVEDGLLQGREIAALDLRDSLVVASACQTAEGRLLQGEGVLSLARSFFLGGARSIVATRWPLRDDHASQLFQLFYAELAAGRTVATALDRARTQARRRGLPSEAWGALVLIGDPDLRLGLQKSGPSRRDRELWALLILGALLLGLSLVLALRRRAFHHPARRP